MPGDPLFCPRLACTVHDYIFKGFSQPTIGSFIIPVGDLIHKLKKEREEETGVIENICNELEKIMKDQGVVSYNLQEEAKGSDFGQSVRSSQKQVKDVIKKVNGDKDAKQPLLLNYDGLDEKENMAPPEIRTPSRKTPSQIALSQGKTNKSKNIMKLG